MTAGEAGQVLPQQCTICVFLVDCPSCAHIDLSATEASTIACTQEVPQAPSSQG